MKMKKERNRNVGFSFEIVKQFPGGGGGTLIFSAYVGSDPASALHPQKISGISSTPKNIWNFSNPKKYPQFCTLPLRKDLKMHRNYL